MTQRLTPYQRTMFGSVENGVNSAAALLEAVVLLYYNDKLGVSLEYLGLAGFVIGTMAAYVAVLAGKYSDQSVWTSRRKAYVLFFGPLCALGMCMRYGGFVSPENAAIYYVITYAMQIAGYTGLAVVMQAWGVELVTEVGERSKLYAVSTGCSFGGVVIGLMLANISLKMSAVIVPFVLLLGIALCCLHLPDNTPFEKRAYLPTVVNISSVFWNSQFLVYLVASSLVAFVNTLPSLVIFFIKYCVGVASGSLTEYYSACIGAFACGGVIALPFMKSVVDSYGTLDSLKVCLLVAAVMGLAIFACSYVSIFLIVACFSLIGLFSTIAHVVLAILYAQTIDYDELLCGKKRASTYSGVHTPVRLFIQIAGASVPLILMAAFGFQQSNDDNDDKDSSSPTSTLILRLWCSVFISFCMLSAYITLGQYKIDVIIYKEIRANIAKRDAQNAAFDEEELSATSNRSQISSRNNRPLSQRSGGRPISGRCSSISGLTQSKSSSGIGGTIKMISDLLTDYNSPEDQMQLAGMYGRPRTVSNAMSGMILRVGELPSSADAQVTSGTGASDVNGTGLLVDAKNVGVDCSSRSNSEVVQSFRVDVMLNSVDDPVTQQPVKPPPFALVAQLISRNFPPSLLVSGGSLLVEDTDAMDENMRDEANLRLLGLYFPQLLHLCCSKAGRAHLVSLYWIEVALFSAASGYATVQAILALAASNQDVVYLTVFLSVIYSLYLAYLLSLLTGVLLLSSLQKEPRRELDKKIETIVQLLYCNELGKVSLDGVTSALHVAAETGLALRSTDLFRIDSGEINSSNTTESRDSVSVSVSGSGSGLSMPATVSAMRHGVAKRLFFCISSIAVIFAAVHTM